MRLVTETLDIGKRQSTLSMLSKAGVSIALIAVLIWKSNIGRYAELLQGAVPAYIITAILITLLFVVISAYKWQLLITAQRFSVPLRKLISSYFVGLFFNNFLPTSIGGDVVRIFDLRKMIGNGNAAAASVVAERVLASVTLGLIVLSGAALNAQALAGYRGLILIFTFICAASFVAVIYSHKLSAWLKRSDSALSLRLRGVADSIQTAVENRPVLLKVLFYSFICQVMVVLVNLAIIKAFGLKVPIAFVFLFIPMIFAISMLPVSLNGLGVREAAYVYFFGRVGLSTEESLAISICFILIVTLVSLTGGVIFATRK